MSEKVKIKSLVSRSVSLINKELRVNRTWERKGAVTTIDFDVLEEMMYDPGTLYMFENGILGIDDMDVKVRLGLEPEGAEEPTNIIILTDEQRKEYLLTLSLNEFKEKLKELPTEQVRELVNYAVENEVPVDFTKADVLKRMTGIDILSAIRLNRQDKEPLPQEG